MIYTYTHIYCTFLDSYLAEYRKLETFILHNGSAVNSTHLSQYRLFVSKYCYAVTYQRGGKESHKTIKIRADSADVLYGLVTDRLSFLLVAAQQQQQQQQQRQKSDYSDDGIAGKEQISRANVARMEKQREEIVNAFHSFSNQQSCVFFGGAPTSVCDSNALAMYSTVLVYRQSIPELLKLTLELYYELLNILHEKTIKTQTSQSQSADLPLSPGIISIR